MVTILLSEVVYDDDANVVQVIFRVKPEDLNKIRANPALLSTPLLAALDEAIAAFKETPS